MFVSSWAVFLEKEFFGEGANTYKIELNEVYKVKGLTHTKLDLISESNLKSIIDRLDHLAARTHAHPHRRAGPQTRSWTAS